MEILCTNINRRFWKQTDMSAVLLWTAIAETKWRNPMCLLSRIFHSPSTTIGVTKKSMKTLLAAQRKRYRKHEEDKKSILEKFAWCEIDTKKGNRKTRNACRTRDHKAIKPSYFPHTVSTPTTYYWTFCCYCDASTASQKRLLAVAADDVTNEGLMACVPLDHCCLRYREGHGWPTRGCTCTR